MSSLSVYPVSSPQVPNKILTHLEDVASTLAAHGVSVDRLEVTVPVRPGAGRQEVIEALRLQVDALVTNQGHGTVEVTSLDDADAGTRSVDEVREHLQAGVETYWIVAGQALLNLHIGDYVYAMLCERHDRISVPAGTRLWLDLGERPRVVVVRVFDNADGQASRPTGDPIAAQFPRLDDLT
jgi:1,2-dihydroxy-3-keto-5-methylthiopentene dioxygenase